MTENITIKQISEKDLDEVYSIYRDYVNNNVPLSVVREWFHENPRFFLGCYKKDGDEEKIVGIVFARQQNNELILEAIAVLSSYWRKGIGTKLLRALEDVANTSGIERISAGVASNVKEFYEKNGYRMAGVLKEDEDETVLIMEKNIKK